jgi:hypothetical protein
VHWLPASFISHIELADSFHLAYRIYKPSWFSKKLNQVCFSKRKPRDGAAADGRCRKCRAEGKMSTVVDTGVETEEEAEEAAPPSLSSLSQSLALAVPAPDIVGCPRSPRSPRSRSRSRSPRLAALVHKLEGDLGRQRKELETCKNHLNELYRYTGASSELEQPQPLASMAQPSAFDSAASSELVSPQPLASDPAPSALASTFCPAQQFVTTTATAQYPIMERTDIAKCLMQPNFGERMCQPQYRDKIDIYNYVAGIAMSHNQFKYTALQSKLWSLRPRSEWLSQAINLTDRSERPSFHCIPNIYKYTDTLPETLIVDFANRTVGGGCFNRGFVQEEQIVAQSNDFTIRLHKHRQRLFWNQGISYQGVYMDACWSRDAAEKKIALRLTDIHAQRSNPLTILAVDAPSMHAAYCSDDLQMLAAKILIIFAAAEQLHSPQIFSGLLGGGAFRNNRPLVLLLHLLLQPRSSTRPMLFHHPVFWSFSDFSKHALETNIVSRADTMLKALRAQNVTTLGHALSVIYDWGLTLSEHDMDLI